MHSRRLAVAAAFSLALVPAVQAQDTKPVPRDSVRIYVPGCSKGQVFTAGRRAEDQPAGSSVPVGTHLRMAGPKKLIAEIKAREGTRVEITGLIKRGQDIGGTRLGGVRITGGPPVAGGAGIPTPGSSQLIIDVEGWRPLPGECEY
ncbi:MAG: hypothetical protein AB7J63_09270 [Vicinamibacterales bacterium]